MKLEKESEVMEDVSDLALKVSDNVMKAIEYERMVGDLFIEVLPEGRRSSTMDNGYVLRIPGEKQVYVDVNIV